MLRAINRRPGAPSQPEFSSLATALLTERVLRMATSSMVRPALLPLLQWSLRIALDPFAHRASERLFVFAGTHAGWWWVGNR